MIFANNKELCIRTTPESVSVIPSFPKTTSATRLSIFIHRKLKKKTVRRRAIGFGLIVFNVVLLASITLFMVADSSGDTQRSLASATTSASNAVTSPLDQLSSANIALTVARMSNLPETTAVNSQAISEDVDLADSSMSNALVSAKPQVVSSAYKSAKDIQTYVVVSGDTIPSIAAKFNVTSDSVRWSNGLTGDTVAVGTKLRIPPVNGIVYVVANGDTADTIAGKFNADKAKIIAYNDAEINGIQPGQVILVPDGTKAAPVRDTRAFSGVPQYGYGYDFGYCTYWVAVLRAKAGSPVPSNLGNASTWAIRAAGFGLSTGTTPQVGAAVVTKTAGEGHVAYVTAVNPDGSITISEMNHSGWNKVDSRTISGNFSYIY